MQMFPATGGGLSSIQTTTTTTAAAVVPTTLPATTETKIRVQIVHRIVSNFSHFIYNSEGSEIGRACEEIV